MLDENRQEWRWHCFSDFEALGVLPRRQVADLVQKLDEDGKRQLAKAGVRIGVDMLFMPDLLKPAQIEITALLYSLYHGEFLKPGHHRQAAWLLIMLKGLAIAIGKQQISPIGGRVMRVDMAERLAAVIRAEFVKAYSVSPKRCFRLLEPPVIRCRS